jgi:hypothetical protein
MNMALPHECYLLYAFPHSASDTALTESAVTPSASWQHWISRLHPEPEALAKIADHSFSFLPHVRRLLFPEFANSSAPEITAIGSTLQPPDVLTVRKALTPAGQKTKEYYSNTSVRLTWVGRTFSPGSDVYIQIPEGTEIREHKLKLRWTDAILFPEGVGVIVVALVLPEGLDTATTARLMRFLKKIEFRRRLTVAVADISDSPADVPGRRRTTWAKVLELLLNDLPFGPPKSAKITAAEIASTLGVNWRIAIAAHVRDLEKDDYTEPFTSIADRICFALTTGRLPSSTNPNDIPSQSHWTTLRSGCCLSLWADWQMLYHYDNLVQVITADNADYAAHQYENFENEYLPLFILATAQRHALDLMEIELTRISGRVGTASGEVQQFTSKLIRFNTRLWHLDVSTTPVGAPLYSMLRSQLQLNASLDTIRADMAELEAYLMARAARQRARAATRTQHLVEILTIIIAPLGVLVELLQDQLKTVPFIKTITPTQAVGALLGAALVTGIIWAISRRSARSDRDEF